ncbi:MFS transporter [Cohnella sp. 56]|uniref:MFS transporter n=1 Tax=Cohnella sp. 56 TaxID=3113722 RepID=UPI0030E78823
MDISPSASAPSPDKGPILMRLMLLTTALTSMSALMLNIVLPQISRELHLSLGQASWLSTSYTLIYALGTVAYGKLADRYRLKNLLTFGLVVFAAGSLIGLASQSFWMTLLARCLQSAGASVVPATAMIVPVRYFAPERRGSALSMTSVGLAIGSALGPAVSALIVSFAHWRWLFLPPLLLLLLLPFYRRHLDLAPADRPGSFDWVGGGLLAASIALLLLGVTNRSATLAVCGLAALALFALRVRRAREPFIRPALLRNPRYAAGLAVMFALGGIGSSLYFVTPLLLGEVHRMSSASIGFAMVPAAAAAAILGRFGGRLADRKGNMCLFAAAACMLAACFLLLSTFAGAPQAWIVVSLVLGNAGQSLIGIAMSNTISRTLAKDQVAIGMSLFSMTGFIAQGLLVGIYAIAIGGSAPVSWNPLNSIPGSYVYGNLYLLLALSMLAVLVVYAVTFGTPGRRSDAPRSFGTTGRS